MWNCQRLVQMMYPTYISGQDRMGASIDRVPYFKIKFANLIQSTKSSAGAGNDLPAGSAAKQGGLFCTLGGVDYSPEMDLGVYVEAGKIYPKLVSLSLELTVLHDHLTGTQSGTSDSIWSAFPWQAPATGPLDWPIGVKPPAAEATTGESAAYSDATGIDQATANMMEEEAMKFEQMNAMAAADPGADGAMPAPTDQQQSCEEQNASEVLMSGGGPMMSDAIMTHDTSADPTAGFTPSHDASK